MVPRSPRQLPAGSRLALSLMTPTEHLVFTASSPATRLLLQSTELPQCSLRVPIVPPVSPQCPVCPRCPRRPSACRVQSCGALTAGAGRTRAWLPLCRPRGPRERLAAGALASGCLAPGASRGGPYGGPSVRGPGLGVPSPCRGHTGSGPAPGWGATRMGACPPVPGAAQASVLRLCPFSGELDSAPSPPGACR